MKTVRLTTAQAIVRYLVAQRTVVDGREEPLFPGVFAIFGHGNVTGLGNALVRGARPAPDVPRPERAGDGARRDRVREGDAAAAGHGRDVLDRARRDEHGDGGRRRAREPAAAALLSGDTFQSRIPDPVLQQVEHFGSPSTTVNDAFRAVTRYWDRITHPEQVAQSLPLAVETMLDPADCGPAFLGLPQDVQADAYDYPEATLRAARARAAAAAAGRLESSTPPRPRSGARGGRSCSRAAASTTRSRRRARAVRGGARPAGRRDGGG